VKLESFKFIGFIVLVLAVTVSIGACDLSPVEDDPLESYVSSITITDEDDNIIEEDADAFSVHYEDGVIDDFEYDEEESELTASVVIEGEVDLSLEVDNDEVQDGGFNIIEGEQTVTPADPDAVFEVEFTDSPSYTASITITDEDDNIIEEDADAFSVHYEDGVIDDFEYDEEESELTASVELEGEVDLSLEVDNDEVQDGGFYIIEGEQTVTPINPEAVFEVEFTENDIDGIDAQRE